MDTDLTIALAELLTGLERDKRPGMEGHHSRLDEFRAALSATGEYVDGIFTDDLLATWADCSNMTPEAWAAMKLDLMTPEPA